MLSESAVQRYSRQLLLPQFSPQLQEQLSHSRVLVIGVGGLGSPAALYLAAAGIGTLGLADGDTVDLSNLNRQILHSTGRIGQSKVASAHQVLSDLNPEVTLVNYPHFISHTEIQAIINDYAFVIDATDSIDAKFMINAACVAAQIPYSHAGILGFQGQAITWQPGHTCYRCIFRDIPALGQAPTCSQAGVLGPVAGMLGTLQAAEAIKVLTGIGAPILDQLWQIDLLTMAVRVTKIPRDPLCPDCGKAAS